MKNTTDKGVETMFRITSNNNQKLNDMADNKAHIMIQVNSIILSIVISVILGKLDDHPNLLVPVSLLLLINISALAFALLATRPILHDGKFTEKAVHKKKADLLFFGDFYQMSLNDFSVGMHSIMKDSGYLYESLIMDVHTQGVMLGKKYRLLRMSYNIFMYGIILAVLAFLTATIVNIEML